MTERKEKRVDWNAFLFDRISIKSSDDEGNSSLAEMYTENDKSEV